MDMNKFLLTGMAVVLAVSCTSSRGPVALETRHYAESTAHSSLTMDVELPLAQGKAATQIRRQLVDVMDEALSHIDNYEEERAFPPFDGDVLDSEALFSYYEKNALESLGAASDADINDRVEGIRESDGLTEEEKERFIARLAGWEYEYTLKKVGETDGYVVFDSRNYISRGGTHGGIIGAGPQTFSKKDGSRITEFFVPDCLEELQPLLVKGLGVYYQPHFDGDPERLLGHLSLKDGKIPLPEWAPYPSENELELVYQQYEIGPYVDGMPACTLPWEEVEPFLTPQAKAVL